MSMHYVGPNEWFENLSYNYACDVSNIVVKIPQHSMYSIVNNGGSMRVNSLRAVTVAWLNSF